jgi:CSLREA domain-containing protein
MGELLVSNSVTILGPGADVLAVNGNAASRVFHVSSNLVVTIASLTVTNGRVTGIPPGGTGAGIFNDHSTLTVSNCTVTGNSAQSAGGGIFNDGGGLTVIASTLSGNSGTDVLVSPGGAIFNNGGAAAIINSTVSGNSVAGSLVGGGGGIYNAGATLMVTASTFSGNSAASGGGIFNSGANGTVEIGDTILKAGSGVNIVNDSSGGPITSDGYNLSSDDSSSYLNQATDQNSTDPMLGPLAYYGGPTPTHILKTGSPAINKGKNLSGATTDQRGFARTVGTAAVTGGDGTDIGAFERQPSDIDPTLVVTTTADTSANSTCDPSTPCSLRDAITAANASGPDDVIYFAVTGAISLGSQLPNLTSNIKINGPGARSLTVKRDSNAIGFFGIFTVASGTVGISGLTISAGNGPGGGGIANVSTLSVSNCTVSGNSCNIVCIGGGGIYNSGTLTVSNSTLSSNSSSTDGGGIYNDAGTITVSNSTLSDNTASGSGGGIENHLRTFAPTLTVNNSTLSGNSAATGGGIFNDVTGTLNLNSSIVANNTAPSGGPDVFGTVASGDYNLVKNTSDATLSGTHNITGMDPMLGPLADNGGPTFTRALLTGSPAIDKGVNLSSLASDQRGPGFVRTFDNLSVTNASGGDGTDIGAFEVQDTPPTITGATISRAQHSSSTSQIATVSDNEDPPSALTVKVNGGTSATTNGVTVSSIAVDNSGNVTATVAASCSATNSSFTLRVTDTGSLYAEATLTVNVTANATAPVITLKPATVLQPNVNHSYRTFTISQMVQSATDDCDGNVINNVVIEKATSDEVENSPGPGDGNTLNDIVIANDCKSVQLRAERDGTLNGRVYLVTLRVSDSSGNVTRAVYKVSVPVGKAPAVDSGVHYTVNSACPP